MSVSYAFTLEAQPSALPVGSLPTPSVPPPERRAADFREYVRALSPGFLKRAVGERLVGFTGLLFDMLTEGAMLAVSLRSHISRAFDPGVAELLGSERSLPRYPGETELHYLERVLDAWRIWQLSGTEQGLSEQLQHLGIETAVYWRNADVMHWDADTENWSRVWIEVPHGQHPWRHEGTFGDGQILGDGGTIGTNASLAEVEAVRSTVAAQKPGHVRVVSVMVALHAWSEFAAEGPFWGHPAERPYSYAFWEG